MGSVIITDRWGIEIYRSGVQYTSPFTARDTIAPTWATSMPRRPYGPKSPIS